MCTPKLLCFTKTKVNNKEVWMVAASAESELARTSSCSAVFTKVQIHQDLFTKDQLALLRNAARAQEEPKAVLNFIAKVMRRRNFLTC